MGETSLIIHQIIDFTPAPALTQPVTSRTFSTHPLHQISALDSGSETRYVRRQGRGREI